MEVRGVSLGREPEVPIYTLEPAAAAISEGDIELFHFLESRLVVAGVAEAVLIEQARRAEGHLL